MLYRVLRWAGGVALQWYYREVTVEGLEHVPPDAPLLVVSNHPNQLVDALLVGTSLQRDVLFTGKAILLDNAAMAFVMRRLPFVPLRRAHDEKRKLGERRSAAGPARGAPPEDHDGAERAVSHHQTRAPASASAPAPDPSRNAGSFSAIHDALAARQAVLIFPEGISHHAPQLAPIKTGAARIALAARDERGIRDVHVLPVGLNFEDKAEPRTRVLVRIGAPIAVDAWRPEPGDGAVDALTRDIDEAMRAVTLNFPTDAERARIVGAARLLSGLFAPVTTVPYSDVSLAAEHEAALRADRVRRLAEHAEPALRERVDRFAARLDALADALVRHRMPVTDLELDTGAAPGARFVVREGLRALLTAPLALWGRLNHWLPVQLALLLGRRTSRTPEDPAMHTIVAGLATVVVAYLLQSAVVWRLAGPWWALAYLVTLPFSAAWDFRFRDYIARATARVRAYRTLRADTALRERLREDVRWLREEAVAIERAFEANGQAVPA
jgi:glycerol-3-phosphate O-acyltransferase/dihydroxyacetone phosphate acyltransferase